jgi:hypothetical protein
MAFQITLQMWGWEGREEAAFFMPQCLWSTSSANAECSQMKTQEILLMLLWEHCSTVRLISLLILELVLKVSDPGRP